MSSVSWQRRLKVEEREVMRRSHLKQEEDLRKRSHWEEMLEQEEVLGRRSHWKQVLQQWEEDEGLRRKSRWKELLVTVESLLF